MFDLLIQSLYFILPAYLANMSPVLAGKLKLPGGNPISKKWLGDHKTWRGFYTGYLGALLVLAGQFALQHAEITNGTTLLHYTLPNIFLYAIPFGIGAIFGDATKSFFKRRLGIKPGGLLFPFDQIDFVLGTYLFLLPIYTMPWQVLLTLLIVTPVLHLSANMVAYKLKLKKVWW